MARKPKIQSEKKANGQGPEPGVGNEPNANSATAKPKQKKAAPKKKAPRAIKAPVSRKTSSSASVREPSDEEIRLRAYFIAERRIQLSLEGDSAHDWIEAKRQLIEEAGPASS